MWARRESPQPATDSRTISPLETAGSPPRDAPLPGPHLFVTALARIFAVDRTPAGGVDCGELVLTLKIKPGRRTGARRVGARRGWMTRGSWNSTHEKAA